MNTSFDYSQAAVGPINWQGTLIKEFNAILDGKAGKHRSKPPKPEDPSSSSQFTLNNFDPFLCENNGFPPFLSEDYALEEGAIQNNTPKNWVQSFSLASIGPNVN
jgi:hypothetical protein